MREREQSEKTACGDGFRLHEIPEVCGTDPLRSELYRATVNGAPCGVRICRVSAVPFNTDRLPRQRPPDQTEIAAFMTFSGSGPARIRVKSSRAFAKATVRPLGRGIEPRTEGEEVEFTLPRPGQYVLELDSEHHALHLFYDPPTEVSEKSEVTRFFGPGAHFPGRIDLVSGDRVYIDPGAVVYGSIHALHVRDVKIFGGGVLDAGVHERVFWNDCVRWAAQCAVMLIGCEEVELRDIVILDSPIWTVGVFDCEKVLIDRIKVVGQWRYNTDGIDLVNSSAVTVRNSFIRSFDDGICLKGLDWAFADYGDWQWRRGHRIEDIRVSGCVVWCGWGRSLEIGIETDTPEYRDIVFEDCDLIHNSCVAIDIANGYGAPIHEVAYRDIRVEFQADTRPEIIQTTEEQRYEPDGRKQPPNLFTSHNYHYLPFPSPWGETYDILLEDIRVFAEPGVGKLKLRMCSYSPEPGLRNHVFRNLTVNGEKIRNVEQLDYETEGGVDVPVFE